MTKEQKEQFNNFRFAGLDYKEASNKYFTMKRVNAEQTKIVVKVAPDHLVKTKFGYALILDKTHVVFIKDWQVNNNFYGTEVILTKEYFNVKEWGDHNEFAISDEFLSFEKWVEVAKAQDNLKNSEGYQVNQVKWEK
jgi:hypothetical protein